ncbi:unnamed protein product [Dibothriocephalus latus]|uniref:Uncharacterized protein n=1 Tax=Dibothriocephalus latus TaxID=60516 RepID=A0A3P7NX98_DIBLA|nr:unnamed protein product [Dibothriocephalus latus]
MQGKDEPQPEKKGRSVFVFVTSVSVARPEGMTYVTTINDVHQYRDLEGRPYFTLKKPEEPNHAMRSADSLSLGGTNQGRIMTDLKPPLSYLEVPTTESVYSIDARRTGAFRVPDVVDDLALSPDWLPPFSVTRFPKNGRLGISVIGTFLK